jgi:tRNA modification GTPase
MFIGFDDTIAAPATIPGTGALTVIRVSGRDCFSTLSKVVRFRSGDICDFEGYTIHYGEVFGKDSGLLDEVLVSVFRAPHSYSG